MSQPGETYSPADETRLERVRDWYSKPGDGYEQWWREDLLALGEDGLRRLFVGDMLEADEYELWLGRLMSLDKGDSP